MAQPQKVRMKVGQRLVSASLPADSFNTMTLAG